MKTQITFLCILISISSLFAGQRIYVSSYAKGKDAKAIHVVDMDLKTGALTFVSSEASGENPSFLAQHPNGKILYAVNQIDSGTISSFSIDANSGSLSLLNRYSTKGSIPCHLGIDPSAQLIAVANYMSGSVASFKLKENGELSPLSSFTQHYGSSVHQRQRSAHAHSINYSKDGKFAYSADLGNDKLMVYSVDTQGGKLIPMPTYSLSLPPGSGPRHIAFNSDETQLFILNELSSMLSSFKVIGQNQFELVGHYKTIQENQTKNLSTAEVFVHPNDQYVYASNRGNYNSITVFKIHDGARLEKIQTISAEGKTPRNFALSPDGKWLLAGLQNSNNIRVFKLDPQTGKLSKTEHSLALPKPVCIIFSNTKQKSKTLVNTKN